MSWRKDRVLLSGLLVGLLLRVIPMIVWRNKPCVRDECTYEEMATALLDGKGIVGTEGWLWAPAYPSLMALHSLIFGGYPRTIQITQLAVSLASAVMLYVLTRDFYNQRAGRIAAWMYLINPTFIFYTTSQWSETIYAGVLLSGLMALRWAREGEGSRGWLPGFVVGICVLFRGVATYILPLFVIGLLWERWRSREAWKAAVACVLMAVLTVAPYSLYATQKFGALVISDRTLGQMMWLGNNTFPPMTFDYGNGVLARDHYKRVKASGRPHCEFEDDPVKQDACETANGVAWIKENPDEFLRRVPIRVAQMLNPHSFLTRHLRWGRWVGLPEWLDTSLIFSIVGFSFLNLAGGTYAWVTRGRGWFAATAGLIVFYHIAAISVLAGLSRYRVPLEPLWMVFLAGLIAMPHTPVSRARQIGGILLTMVVIGFMLVYLPAGWPSWHSW